MAGDDDRFDVLVIGGGQAGTPLVLALQEKGKRAALAERKWLGGSCVNFGCTPTKAAIASARVAHLARRAAEFGLVIPEVRVDFSAVLRGARAVVMESRNGLEEEFQGDATPTLLRGHARLDGKDGDYFQVRIGDARTVRARDVVLDTGTRALIPPIDGLDTVPYLTADDWLDHDDLPEHLILLGGGYIGMEMGQFYRRMGSRVTIIDRSDRIAPHEDDDVCRTLQPLLEQEGITFRLGSTVTKAARDGAGIAVSIQGGEGRTETLRGSHLFVAAGRKPNTDDLGLETVGVSVDSQGIVGVDRHLRTNVPGVWATGDIRGGPMFTHTAWDDYRIVLSAMTGDGSHTTDRIVPYAVFTDPQIGRVGMTEDAAKQSGKKIKVGRYDMRHNGRAREYRERPGFVKVIVDADTDRLLGASVVSDEAAELVHVYVDLMNAGAPYTNIRKAVYIHPTYAEAIQSATEAVPH